MERPRMIIRPACEADAYAVWAWRQDPVTRAMSRAQAATPLEDHLTWFAAALRDPSRTLLIGEAEGVAVGMVRFDRGALTEVSINVNPAFRGQGVGRTLLALALRAERDAVWAEVKDENQASRRLFENAGFELHEASGGIRRYLRPAPSAESDHIGPSAGGEGAKA